jgi:hypothetical protein
LASRWWCKINAANLRCGVLEGKLPRRALNLVLDWAELHRDELLSDWDKCRLHHQPDKIKPLP